MNLSVSFTPASVSVSVPLSFLYTACFWNSWNCWMLPSSVGQVSQNKSENMSVSSADTLALPPQLSSSVFLNRRAATRYRTLIL
jgi:hypothetical protein